MTQLVQTSLLLNLFADFELKLILRKPFVANNLLQAHDPIENASVAAQQSGKCGNASIAAAGPGTLELVY